MENGNGKIIFKCSNYGNIGTIEEVYIFPYHGAAKKEKGYRVTAKAAYDNNFIYHVSVFETLTEAKNDLKKCAFVF